MMGTIKRYASRCIFVVLIVLVIFICLFIPYIAVVSSLQTDQQVLCVPAEFTAKPVVFRNYIDIWSEVPLARLLWNGVVVTFPTILLTFLIAIPASYALAKLDVPARRSFLILILFTQMFSPAVVLVPLFNLFRALNLLDSYLGLIIINTTFSLAFSTLLLTGFFNTIPNDVLNAALIDGCNNFQTIIKIILPISAPGIFVVTIYIFTQVWNEFFFAFSFINSSDKFTPIVGLFSLIQPPGLIIPPWNLAMAMSVIISIPVVILFYFRQADMAKGLSTGAIK
jgi:multiple sugar transport system permease protein